MSATVLSGPRAAADTSETARFRISYAAPSGCPDHAAFVAHVLARSERLVVAGEGEQAREFRVAIRQHEGGFEGEVHATFESAETSTRSVPGASCASVAEALALVVALALDPQASALPQESSGSSDAASTTEPVPSSSEALPASPPAEPAARAPGVDAGVPRGPARAAAAPRVAWFVLLDGTVAAGIAPSTLLSPGVAAELEMDPWLFRLTLHGTLSSWLEQGAGAARFVWTAARLDGCAPKIGDVVQLWPCASFEAGALYAEGSGTDADRAATDAWLAPGLNARVRWLPGASWLIEAQAGASRPLLRQRYLLPAEDTGNTEVYRVPAVAGWAGIAGGVRLD